MSTRMLVQAGLTSFAGFQLVAVFVMWNINAEAIAELLRSAAGLAFLIAMAPVETGLFLLHRNKKDGTKEPGLIWASIGIHAGVLLAMAILIIPVIMTLRSLFTLEPA